MTEKMDNKGLRGILVEEIIKLRKGETTPASINAITNATGKILSSVKLEIEYHKMLGLKPDIDFVQLTGKSLITGGPADAEKPDA